MEDQFVEKKTSNNQEHLSRNRLDREAERRATNTMKSESSELHAADSVNEEGKGIKIIKRT